MGVSAWTAAAPVRGFAPRHGSVGRASSFPDQAPRGVPDAAASVTLDRPGSLPHSYCWPPAPASRLSGHSPAADPRSSRGGGGALPERCPRLPGHQQPASPVPPGKPARGPAAHGRPTPPHTLPAVDRDRGRPLAPMRHGPPRSARRCSPRRSLRRRRPHRPRRPPGPDTESGG
jgi:hypothetical protein